MFAFVLQEDTDIANFFLSVSIWVDGDGKHGFTDLEVLGVNLLTGTPLLLLAELVDVNPVLDGIFPFQVPFSIPYNCHFFYTDTIFGE